jgi:predicted AAA+ superfamily ATPase
MKRDIDQPLNRWVKQPSRVPLLLRGARQIGKTFTVRQLAKTCFKNLVEINFELEPFYAECFQSLQPQTIINLIMSLSRQNIIAGETLLFLDEIQECPNAIMALRYFKELMPELHVIGAGSLLEFVLNEADFRMPVGRVQYMYMHPLSFREYLQAMGYERLLEQLRATCLNAPPEKIIHEKLLSLVREYLFTGGMPDAIKTYIDTQDFPSVQYKQTILLNTYRNDFGKYAKHINYKYLQKVFDKTPQLLGQQVKYSKIDETMRSRDLKKAIACLNKAGVIRSVYSSSASGLPLHALINEKKFKLLFLDIGLLIRATQVSAHQLFNEDLNLIYQGGISEQFVGQELLSYQDCLLEPELHYWSRDVVGSQAELDYVVTQNSQIIPIEVKAGKTGTLKSLHQFMSEKNSRLGIRISESPFTWRQNILSVPFYLIGELSRLIGDSN